MIINKLVSHFVNSNQCTIHIRTLYLEICRDCVAV